MANDEDIKNAVKAALAAEREAKARAGSLQSMQQQLAAETKLLEAYEKTANSQEGRFLAATQQSKVLAQQVEIMKTQAKLSGDMSQETIDQIKNLERQKEESDLVAANIEKTHISLKESVMAAESLAKKLTPVGVWASEYANNTILATSTFKDLNKAVRGGVHSMKAFTKTLVIDTAFGFIDAIVGLAFAADRMESSFGKATGASPAMAREITGVYEATRLAGVSTEEANQSAIALYTTYTDFTMQAPAVRTQLTKTVAILGEFGISAQDAGRSVQLMTKAMAITGPSSDKALIGLANYGRAIGVTPQQMMRDFNTAGGALAKFGDEGLDTFKDLARVAKITGIEVGRLLQMTAEFDTFEGAANQAGKLNAALGGNFVNAMDLMMETDPVARFKMIRASITEAGLSFDTMSYYQKRFYTQQLGFKDEAELAAALSGDLDSLGMGVQKTSEDYRKMRADAAAMQSVQDQLRNLFLDMIPVLTPLIDAMRQFVGYLRENPKIVKRILFVGGSLLAFFVAWKVAMLALSVVGTAWNVIKGVAVGLWEALTFWIPRNTDGIIKNTAAMAKNIGLGAAWALGIAAVGKAVHWVATGLGEMAEGFAVLVATVKGMKTGEMQFIKELILGIAGSIGKLIGVVALMGPWAGLASPAIYAMGTAFEGFGLGVKIASEGIGTLIDKFRKFLGAPTSANDLKLYGEELTKVGTAMAGIAIPGLKAAAGLTAMALAMGVLGLSLKFIGDDLPMFILFVEAVDKLAVSLGNLDTSTGLTNIRNELAEWDAVTVGKLATIATSMAAVSAVGAVGGKTPDEATNKTEARGQSEDSPLIVRDISSTQSVKIVIDAAETRRFLKEGTLDTIGEVVLESLRGGQ